MINEETGAIAHFLWLGCCRSRSRMLIYNQQYIYRIQIMEEVNSRVPARLLHKSQIPSWMYCVSAGYQSQKQPGRDLSQCSRGRDREQSPCCVLYWCLWNCCQRRHRCQLFYWQLLKPIIIGIDWYIRVHLQSTHVSHDLCYLIDSIYEPEWWCMKTAEFFDKRTFSI
jgi:hypothetical protein